MTSGGQQIAGWLKDAFLSRDERNRIAARVFTRLLFTELISCDHVGHRTSSAAGSQEKQMPTLPLAVGIADAISEAEAPLDMEAKAAELSEAHPEAEASREDIQEVLESEAMHDSAL